MNAVQIAHALLGDDKDLALRAAEFLYDRFLRRKGGYKFLNDPRSFSSPTEESSRQIFLNKLNGISNHEFRISGYDYRQLDFKENMIYVDGEDLWITKYEYEYEGVASECGWCNLLYLNEHLAPAVSGSWICESCIESRGFVCNSDREYGPPEDEEETDEEGYTASYNSDVLNYREGFLAESWEKLPERPLWLGVELELEPRDKYSGYLDEIDNDVGDFAVLKPDGSLSSYGVEIVSVPATLEWHRHHWKRFFNNSAKLMKEWHTENCGMHVHMDKSAISALTLGKMLVFINSDENEKFIDLVGGRNQNTYCYRNNYMAEKPGRYGKDFKESSGTDHHYALSVSEHNSGETVEMRIFRANCAEAGFLKNLEFCVALVEFCKQASAKEVMEYVSFIRWMKVPSRMKQFPKLYAWLVRERFIAEKKESPRKAEFLAKKNMPVETEQSLME